MVRLGNKNKKGFLDLFDLYTYFTNKEIDLIKEELGWLLGPDDDYNNDSRDYSDCQEEELHTIIQLHSRPPLYETRDSKPRPRYHPDVAPSVPVGGSLSS